MHFPANGGLIFLTDELTNDTGATLSIVPCNNNKKIQAYLAHFSKGQMGNPSPLGALFKKLCNSEANF
jgi:hypothetical protein